MGCLFKEGQYPSIGPPTYQIIKVANANHMSMMKTNLTIIPMCPRERFPLYKSLSRLVLCYKKDWATLLHFIYFCYLLLVTNYLITKLSVTTYFSTCREYLAGNRLPKHRSTPYTCESSRLFSGAVAGEWSAFGRWNLVRKNLYSVLKFTVTCYYGK